MNRGTFSSLKDNFFSLFATTIIAFLNFNTAMVLVPGDWDDIKIWFAIPVSLIACILFDNKVSEEYMRERLKGFAKATLNWINIQRERLTQTRLGSIRLETYIYLFQLFEAPFLETSVISIINRLGCTIYLITEFIVSAYLLLEREDLPWFMSIAPILAGLLNLGTGILKGHLIVYPKALKQLRKKYQQYYEEV
ncbi:hypothetical protein PN502_13835 [Microcystis aeruginosa CS-338/01]|uniref:hypothetical protein n=1 Tax=Microcystis aeruginosa TaxID=1126 RepID=UPI00232C754C|nr:hypothetical protein [Microcystis aeruginosa]MDB9508127.1 hypothetical protein [Microcystis aeruginosa CS-338/01]